MENKISKVVEIIEPVFKSGTTDKGPWSLAKVVAEDGNQATVFNPVVIGDQIEMTWNDKYKNWSGKVIKEKQRAQAESNVLLNKVYEQNAEILRLLKELRGDEPTVEATDEPTPTKKLDTVIEEVPESISQDILNDLFPEE